MSGAVLVVGGEGGIGQAICRELKSENLDIISADLAVASFEAKRIPIDITDYASIQRAYDHILTLHENLRAVVVASGVFDHFPVSEFEPGRLERLLRTNVLGVANVINVFLPLLQSGSRIVIISSETALVGLPFQPYGMSKRMLECYIDSLRQECKLIGIEVVSIRPGAHATSLLEKSKHALVQYSPKSRYTKYLKRVADEGLRVINKGANHPEAVGRATRKALVRNSSHVGVHISGEFKLMSLLPRQMREYILRRYITSKGEID